MTIKSHNSDTRGQITQTFMGDLNRQMERGNPAAVIVICAVWPASPGALERYQAFYAPRAAAGVMLSFLKEKENVVRPLRVPMRTSGGTGVDGGEAEPERPADGSS